MVNATKQKQTNATVNLGFLYHCELYWKRVSHCLWERRHSSILLHQTAEKISLISAKYNLSFPGVILFIRWPFREGLRTVKSYFYWKYFSIYFLSSLNLSTSIHWLHYNIFSLLLETVSWSYTSFMFGHKVQRNLCIFS